MRAALVLALCVMAGGASAQRGPVKGVRMVVDCQQNIIDGRILTIDTAIPRNARYKVLRFLPQERGDPWVVGRCEIQITNGI